MGAENSSDSQSEAASKQVSGRFAVIGQPIAHSLSPDIHSLFAKQFRSSIDYIKLPAKRQQFAQTLEQFFAAGGQGANVTLPFKNEAYELCQVLSEEAEEAKAVNTIWQAQGKWYGANTDGAGLIQDLTTNLKVKIQSQRVLLIGAGGAAQGILGPLLRQQPKMLLIANRTPEKAEALAQRFKRQGPVQSTALAALAKPPKHAFDLIIQATSIGHQAAELPRLAPQLCAPNTCCYDLSYGDAAQFFRHWGKAAGALTYDGLGMLIEQAALSFRIWFDGQSPDTKDMAQQLLASTEQADAGAQFSLGLMHYHGDRVEQNYEEAVKWWRKAAEQGHAKAQYELGIIYSKGHPVEQNDETAASWYQKAAKQGHAEAQRQIGNMYLKGKGVEQNHKLGGSWLLKAAEQGHVVARDAIDSIRDHEFGGR